MHTYNRLIGLLAILFAVFGCKSTTIDFKSEKKDFAQSKVRQQTNKKAITPNLKIMPAKKNYIKGSYFINEDLIIAKNTELIIAKGSKLLFKRDCGIICYGSIKAKGIKEQTIEFSAINKSEGWKGILFIGKKSSASFEYCNINSARSSKNFPDLKIRPFFKNYWKEMSRDQIGGALTCINSGKIFLSHCFFVDNKAQLGGGILAWFSDVSITNCKFIGNFAVCWGGSICALNHSKIMITKSLFDNKDNKFIGEDIDSSGVLMYVEEFSFLCISDSEIVNNKTQNRAAIITEYSDVFIQNTKFEYNFSTYAKDLTAFTKLVDSFLKGQNLHKMQGVFEGQFAGPSVIETNRSELTIINCDFSRNYGNVVDCYNTDVEITNSRFDNNFTDDDGVLSLSESAITLSNCQFSRNHSFQQSAVSYMKESKFKIQNCIFSNNSVLGSSELTFAEGGVFVFEKSYGHLYDCKFIENSSKLYGGAIFQVDTNKIYYHNCLFQKNSSSKGGAIALSFPTIDEDEEYIRNLRKDSIFKDNAPDNVKIIED